MTGIYSSLHTKICRFFLSYFQNTDKSITFADIFTMGDFKLPTLELIIKLRTYTRHIMAKGKKQAEVDEMANVEQALTTSEKFIEKNQKPILYTVLVIVLVVLGVLAFRNFYIEPKNTEANNAIYPAQYYFQADSFRLALEGDNMDCIGFEAIADQYGITKAGKLAKYYAGVCNYKLGNYEAAIDYLKSFKSKDQNVSLAAEQLLGDAYIATDNLDAAVKCFMNVGKKGNNIISPMSLKKAGAAYETLGDKANALAAYKEIKQSYPQSQEAIDIDKYIARLEQSK